MVGKKSFERVFHEVDEEGPQSGGKQDGTQHSSGLHRHVISAQKRHNTAFIFLNRQMQAGFYKKNPSNGITEIKDVVIWAVEVTDLCGRFSFTTDIIPREKSMCVYKELIMAMTIISQLDGLAG